MGEIKLSRFQLKIICAVLSILYAVSYIFVGRYTIAGSIFIGLGYFPLFTLCFLLIEGYFLSSNPLRYAIRLTVAGIVAEIPYVLMYRFVYHAGLNVMFAYAVCVFICFMLTRFRGNVALKYLLLAMAIYTPSKVDYGLILAIFTCIYVFIRQERDRDRTGIAFLAAALYHLLSLTLFDFYMPTLTAKIVSFLAIGLSYMTCSKFYYEVAIEENRKYNKVFYIGYPACVMILFILSWIDKPYIPFP